MGRTQAEGFASAVQAGQLPLDAALTYHLRVNHYPPVPLAFVPTCITAIAACADEEWDLPVDLPAGIEWKDGRNAIEASRIAETFHLGPFIDAQTEGFDDNE